jgi:flagellar biosynthesis/type III secretory pathway protein FliH
VAIDKKPGNEPGQITSSYGVYEAPVSLSAALSDAQLIVEAARMKAAEIEAAARADYQSAREKGYADGFASGKAEVAEGAIRLIEESTVLGERLAEEAARLAIAIASTVVQEHVAVTPEAAKRIALRALQDSVIGETVTIIVNPDDVPVMEAALPEFRKIAAGASFAVESEATLTRGGVRVRTEFGEVDASVDAVITALRSRLGIAGG